MDLLSNSLVSMSASIVTATHTRTSWLKKDACGAQPQASQYSRPRCRSERRRHFFVLVRFDDVSNLDVVEVVDGQTTLEAVLDLPDVVLEASK